MARIPGADDEENFDEEELIRDEFNSIVSGLSLDESAPTTYLDELDNFEDMEGFKQPNPAKESIGAVYFSMKRAIRRWLKRGYHDDDGVVL